MSSVTFTGLASGIDSASLVSQLVAAERAPADVLGQHQQDLTTQKSIVGSLSAALASLGTLARGMDNASEVQPRTATSSDSHVSVAASSGASPTVHDVRVQQLARAQTTASRTFSSAAAGVLGTGNLTITTGGATKTVSWSSTDSLGDIAAKINDADAGTTASVLYDGASYRLVLAAKATGTAAAPVFSDGGDGLELSDPTHVKIAARDAIVTLDGVDVTRGSNVVDDAIPGLTLTLLTPHGATDPAAAVAVDLDRGGLRDKVKALVGAYNAVNSALHVQLDYTGSKKGTNTLFGDSTLRQLQAALGTVMSSSYGASTLSTIGINRSKDGAMTLDETALTAALAKNPDAVRDLFVTGGFATAVTTMADSYTKSSDGIFAAKAKSLTDRYAVLQSQIDHINSNADALKSRLDTQFSALETAMSNLKSQSAYLTSIFG